jgi:hypothetical protein
MDLKGNIMTRTASRIGAVSYLIWAVIHLQAATKVYALASGLPMGMVQGRIHQAAWNLGAMAVSALIIAPTMNWRNSKAGYWLNLAIISVTDIGFIVFILVPGYMPLNPGVAGPVFWIIGSIFTTIAYLGA